MGFSISELVKATQLTRHVRLMDATRLIQRVLGLSRAQPRQAAPPTRRTPAPAAKAGPTLRAAVMVDAPEAAAVPKEEISIELPVQPLPASQARPATFTEHFFRFAEERYAYRLYVPSAGDAVRPSPLPLVVLLHGCQQDAHDFAQGTAMNELAEQQRCLVLYPEQLSKTNSMRCWNWFAPAHQARDAGEPGMIAALTREVLMQHNGDPKRVYIAGLSAGGAMAALVAGLYPEIFAAVGVHSGLRPGAAGDVVSAFSAMRRGARGGAWAGDTGSVVPTIVFHGSADKTVHPGNGDQVADAALAALEARGLALEKAQSTEGSAAGTGSSAGSRSAVRTTYSTADGKSYVEHWAVGSGPHAWSGGNAAGSFTDPQGPSASRAMLEFLLQHHK